jgi:plasmid stability protein
MSQRQANIRLENETYERLEVAAFVHRRSVADEMRAAVLQWLDEHEGNPRFAQASGARDPLPDETVEGEEKVSSLAAKRERSRGKEA